jgi:hypothetical protein
MVNTDQIAVAWQCSKRHIQQLRAQGKFPELDLMVGASPRWRASPINVLLKAEECGRRTSRLDAVGAVRLLVGNGGIIRCLAAPNCLSVKGCVCTNPQR